MEIHSFTTIITLSREKLNNTFISWESNLTGRLEIPLFIYRLSQDRNLPPASCVQVRRLLLSFVHCQSPETTSNPLRLLQTYSLDPSHLMTILKQIHLVALVYFTVEEKFAITLILLPGVPSHTLNQSCYTFVVFVNSPPMHLSNVHQKAKRWDLRRRHLTIQNSDYIVQPTCVSRLRT